MAVVDQKERYRRQAALCYDIAATMTGERATSMLLLGDTYSALAVNPDGLPPTVFVPRRGECPSRAAGQQVVPASGESRWITHYIALSFRRAGIYFAPGPPVECPDAALAIQRAELMIREKDIAGAVAFSRRGNANSGEFDVAVILAIFGDIPEGFDIA
jgi:hypothetical protein